MRYCFSLVRVSFKKKDTNELIGRADTDTQTLKNLWLPKGTGGGGRECGLGFGIGPCTQVNGMTGQQGAAV